MPSSLYQPDTLIRQSQQRFSGDLIKVPSRAANEHAANKSAIGLSGAVGVVGDTQVGIGVSFSTGGRSFLKRVACRSICMYFKSYFQFSRYILYRSQLWTKRKTITGTARRKYRTPVRKPRSNCRTSWNSSFRCLRLRGPMAWFLCRQVSELL